MSFPERWTGHIRLAILLATVEAAAVQTLRLCILRTLSEAPGGTANVSMILDGLEDYALSPSRDQVMSQIGWLAENGLALNQADAVVGGAMILDRGRDVAMGRIKAPGVAELPTMLWLQRKLAEVSVTASLDHILGEVDWLRSHNFLARKPADCAVATQAGRDVALGRATVEGVKTPSASTIMRLASNAARDMMGG